MAKRSLGDLLIDVNDTFGRIKVLPKHGITSHWDKEIKNWKAQIADTCMALTLEASKNSQTYPFETPNNDYCIDLRATSHFLPRRLEGQPKQIDEETRTNRIYHEGEIEHGNIICYRATEDGKLVAFEPRPTSLVREVLPILHQLYYFSFPKLKQPATSTYNVKYCAHPKCGELVGREEDHLQLCQYHDEKFMYNIEHCWLPTAAKGIYDVIKQAGKYDSEGIHHRIYFQLLPQLDTWIEQIDRIIPSDCTGTSFQTSSLDCLACSSITASASIINAHEILHFCLPNAS